MEARNFFADDGTVEVSDGQVGISGMVKGFSLKSGV